MTLKSNSFILNTFFLVGKRGAEMGGGVSRKLRKGEIKMRKNKNVR